MAVSVITEDFTLPSHGKLYSKDVNPTGRIRAMTTDQEMRRLSHSDKPYKILCEIVDECIVDNTLGISSYDLTLGDYQYILHKLRIATYGSDYKIKITCPHCGTEAETVLNLDSLDINEYDSSAVDKYIDFQLPRSKANIKLHPQTPRMVDEVQAKTNAFMKRTKGAASDPTLIYTVVALIEEVDGKILDPVELERFVRGLPMMDLNYILQANEKVSSLIGIDPLFITSCGKCGEDYPASFRLTTEFFRPSID